MRVVVIGGGPGGAVTASRLCQLGHEAIVFEKQAFPRFHIGESLLPKSLPILEQIGVLAQVEERFLAKFGARFHDDIAQKKDRFAFDGAWKPEPFHAFQVQRDEFDQLLLEHARKLGADVRMPASVDRILFDGARAVGVESGGQRIEADFVVDATGRDRLVARADGATKIEGLDQTAYYNHYKGVPRYEGKEEGDVDIILFDSGVPTHPNWLWVIPFKDGTASVGAVVSRAWVRAQPSSLRAPNEMLRHAIASSPSAKAIMANAKPLWAEAHATADYSYRVSAIRGPSWLAVGDAGGFIDPLFSTGVHLALVGGSLAAEAIHANTAAAFAAWEEKARAASETFVLAVQCFYKGPLVAHLFAEDKRTPVRRSITSLLAGDVYGDSVWLRDIRLRLREMATAPAP